MVFLLLFALIVAYAVIEGDKKEEVEEVAVEPFRFDLSVAEFGMLDSGTKSRGYATVQTVLSGEKNASIEMIILKQEPLVEIYEVNDYHRGEEKEGIMSKIRSDLRQYNIQVQTSSASAARYKKDSIIIISTDAMPSIIEPDDLREMCEDNVVIFLGKPLDIALDASGSQLEVEGAYDELDLVYDNGKLSTNAYGPELYSVGNAKVASYEEGWLVLYEDAQGEEYGDEIADMILGQRWQQDGKNQSFALKEGKTTFYSPKVDSVPHFIRLIAQASTEEKTAYTVRDLPSAEPLDGRLKIPESLSTEALSYSFELEKNLTYPTRYELDLMFVKNGETVWSGNAKDITVKTIAIENGKIDPDLEAGSYTVNLVDQHGTVHAAAYTHLQKLDVKLVRIQGSTHVFQIDIDDEPAASQEATLTVNDEHVFTIHTDEKGQGKVNFALAPATHKFTVELDGYEATTYYKKMEEGSYILYAVFLIGSLLVGAAFLFKPNGKRKFKIETYRRPPTGKKVIRIPKETFMELVHKTQKERAPSLPITVADLSIGIRRHATYKGTQFFITDSNIFNILEDLSDKGHLLSYKGYFLPADMSEGKPIEYWVLKRMINDWFIERGISSKESDGADFRIGNRVIYIWRGQEPNVFLKHSKEDTIIVFPNEERKQEFIRQTQGYGTDRMRLSLELYHGKIFPQTIGEFMERGDYED